MDAQDQPYSPPAGARPTEGGDGEDEEGREDGGRLPPPVFSPGINRRPVHRAPHLPPPASSLPPNVVYGPDDPPRSRGHADEPASPPGGSRIGSRSSTPAGAREARARTLAELLDRLSEELRRTGTLRFVPSRSADTVEAALRGVLSGVLISAAREDRDESRTTPRSSSEDRTP